MSLLRARIQELAKHHGSLRAAARVVQIEAGYLSRLQNGLKLEPSDDVLRKLGLRRVVTYEPRIKRSCCHGGDWLKCDRVACQNDGDCQRRTPPQTGRHD